MKTSKLIFLILVLVMAVCGTQSFSKASSQTSATSLPIFPLIINYSYETKYLMQWISGCPQYSIISGSISKENPSIVQIVLTEKDTEKRAYYSNSEEIIKAETQAGLNAHFVKIDVKTGEDAEERPAFAFGFADEHNVPIRWRFVAYGASSDRGAGPRIQAVAAGLLVSYNELGTVSAPSSVVQVGDKSYEVEQWDEISKPPYFVGFHGTISDGIAMGTLLKGVENWRVQSSPKELNQGEGWTLINDKNKTRKLQITAKQGDELTISEVMDRTPWARGIEMLVKSSGSGFALKSMTQITGNDSFRITFSPELALFSSSSESSFQIDEHGHQKVLTGTASVGKQGGDIILKLQPKIDGSVSRQTVVSKGYVMTSSITLNENGYRLEVR